MPRILFQGAGFVIIKHITKPSPCIGREQTMTIITLRFQELAAARGLEDIRLR